MLSIEMICQERGPASCVRQQIRHSNDDVADNFGRPSRQKRAKTKAIRITPMRAFDQILMKNRRYG
jgi:hypothetical protein